MREGEQRPVPEIERIGDDAEEGRDSIAEGDVADKRTRMGDDERAARGRDRGAPAGIRLGLAQDEESAEISATPNPAPTSAIRREA